MNIHPVIYLDYNATTPVAPEVMNEMIPYFLSAYGNASSNDHLLGWQANDIIDKARSSITSYFGFDKGDIIFTSGATESLNLVLKGLLLQNSTNNSHLITAQTEHSAVLGTCKVLEENGVEVDYLPVDEHGLINLSQLEDTIKETTRMVSVMMVNNETGVVQPLKEVGEICKRKNVLFVSDATQAIGKVDFKPSQFGIDVMVGSAHKFYGPKGIGFLLGRKEILDNIEPQITGGGQEGGKRAGTTNVPGIVGMAKALELNLSQLDSEKPRIHHLRSYFEKELSGKLNITVHGENAERLYNVSNICFKGVDSEILMQKIGSRVAASRGSACSSAGINASHVLSAMDVTYDDIMSSIRFSIGRYTTMEDLGKALELIISNVRELT